MLNLHREVKEEKTKVLYPSDGILIPSGEILELDYITAGFHPDFLRPVPEPLVIKKDDYKWI